MIKLWTLLTIPYFTFSPSSFQALMTAYFSQTKFIVAASLYASHGYRIPPMCITGPPFPIFI